MIVLYLLTITHGNSIGNAILPVIFQCLYYLGHVSSHLELRNSLSTLVELLGAVNVLGQ